MPPGRHVGGRTEQRFRTPFLPSYFYLIVGGVAILILPDYKFLLGITATQTVVLMVLLGISIGIGGYTAGRVSGDRIRPGLIPIGAIGTTIMFFILGIIPLNFYLISVCLVPAGFLAGFFMVPLQTMTQQLSSEQQRGRVLGLWNCGSFVGVILGNILFLTVRRMLLPNISQEQTKDHLAALQRRLCEVEYRIGCQETPTVSIGFLVVSPDCVLTTREIRQAANTALFDAKKNDKNQFVCASS